jgi:hypothetical protein
MSTIVGNEEDCARACAETLVAIADLMITGWIQKSRKLQTDQKDNSVVRATD